METIKLMCHSMTLYERVHENRISISEEQFGFVKGKFTTDAIFVLRQQLQERYREGQQYLHCVLIDLEKNIRQSPEGRAVFGACEIRVCQRSTSDW